MADNTRVRHGRLQITGRLASLTGVADWDGQSDTSARLRTRGLADSTRGLVEGARQDAVEPGHMAGNLDVRVTLDKSLAARSTSPWALCGIATPR